MQGIINAPQIQGKVGGGLTIESLQDTDHQEGKQESLSASVSVGYGHVSGSLNVNKSGYHSDFASVQQQAGLQAGDGGFQLQVDGNTHLEGAVITSSDQAIADGCNQLETSTLTHRVIENRADYKAHSIGLGGGFSKETSQPQQAALQQNGVGKDQQGQAATGALQVPGSQLPSQHGLSATTPIVMGARGRDSSTTYSGISGAAQAVKITNKAAQQALTGQTPEQAIAGLEEHVKEGSNALNPIFDRQKIEAGFQIVGTLTREVGTFLDNRAKEQTQAQEALKEEQAKAPEQQDQQKIGQLQQTLQENQTWEMGGKGRILLSALTLAAGSNVTGSTGQMLQAAAVNTLQGLGAQQIKQVADNLDSEAARTALQGLLAGAGAAAQGQNATPAALGASASVVLNNLIESAYGEASHQLTADERQARKNLVTTLVAGTTHALGGEAALANAAAALEIENNYLSRVQWTQRKQEIADCENLICDMGIQAKWDLINIGQQASYAAGMVAGVPASLYEAVENIANAAVSPQETYLSLKTLFSSDNVLGNISEAVKQSYIARIDKMNEEYERAGASGSFNAGAEGTKLMADIASLVASGVGVAKGGVALTNFGIKTAQQGIQSAKTIRGVATVAKQGTTAIVPKVSSQVAGISDRLAAGNPLSKAGHVAAKPPGVGSNSISSTQLGTVNLEGRTKGTINIIDSSKFDYLFGKSSSNAHNAARSNQLALEMKRLGIHNDQLGRATLTNHLQSITQNTESIINKFSNIHGNFEVRESLLMGPSGKAAMLQTTFQVMSDGSHRFVTAISFSGVK